MAEGKNRIIVYKDWKSIFDKLTDVEAGVLIKHFFAYVNDMNPVPPDRLTELLFEPIKQTLKRDLRAYEERCVKNRDNVIERWNKKDTNVYERIQNHTKHTDSDNDNDSDNDIKKYNIPTIEEVKAYFRERGYREDVAVRAFEFYNVAKWVDSKGKKVRNWKQKMNSVWFKDENKAAQVRTITVNRGEII